MTLTKNGFLVADALRRCPDATQRAVAKSTGLSVGSVNGAWKRLAEEGLVEEGRLTPAGMKALSPYKVDNAVIMAAGLSSRFAPISYDKPKGLLNVRGEVLIERQIRQLKEAGIDDIIVVVGYKKEYFFYLEDAFGVTIVVNEEYAAKNNHSSLYAVRHRLGNTYICSSDDYFTVNPFSAYAFDAYYAVQHADGPTEEWCLTLGPRGRIVAVEVGGRDAWYMIGHAYFDRAFSHRFEEILEKEYGLPQTADKLWEDLYVDHIDELAMTARPYDQGIIHEFDSLDELRAFDPQFLDNVDSEAFDNIVATLGCAKDEIDDIFPLKQGLTNLSCHIRTPQGEFVYRHPGVGTEHLIDRRAEMAAQQAAKRLGLDGTFVAGDPERGWKISRYLPHCRTLDPHDDGQLARAMAMAAELHGEDVFLERRFDFYEEAKRYEAILLERSPIDVPGYDEMAAAVDRLHGFTEKDDTRICLTHNDFFCLNLLCDDEGRIYLIDWEYAGMGDYANDFGTFTVTSQLSPEEAERALAHYFGRRPTDGERRHNLAFVAFAGWCWYLWSLVKEAEGDNVGEWLYIYYNYAKTYLREALALYEAAETA